MLSLKPGIALAASLVAIGAAFQGPKPSGTLDTKKRAAIEKLANDWFTARPATAFDDWDPDVKRALDARVKALDPVPSSAEKDLRAILWKAARKHGELLDPKNILTTRWGKAAYGVSNAPAGDGSKMGLFIGLHGGGVGAGSKSESQSTWAGVLGKQKLVGVFPQAIQLVHDAWNTVEGERFVLTLVEMAKRTFDIDPDRVFVGGFSMGGTGSWFHAGRQPDLFAAALPFSGVIFPERDAAGVVKRIHHGFVPNIRHVPLYYTAGALDTQCPPDTYVFAEELVKKLRAEHPGDYLTEFRLVPNLGHAFPSGEPDGAYEWMTGRRRKVFPKSLTWEVAKDPMPMPGTGRRITRDFYWLRFEDPADFQRTEAEIRGQEVHVKVAKKDSPLGMTVYLSPELLNVNQEVVVFVNDIVKYRGVPEPSVAAMIESMSARLDRVMVFTRKIEI